MRQTIIAIGLETDLLAVLTKTCSDRCIRLEHLSWPEWCASRLCVQVKGQQKTMLLEHDYGTSIQVEKVAGLISFDRCVPRESLQGVCQDDQDYLYSARQSAWLVMHAIVERTINRMDHTMLQAHYLTLPHIYAVAKQEGFVVPKWGFSSRGNRMNGLVTTNNLTLDTTHNFSKSQKPGMLAVAFVEGQPIVVILIGDAMQAVHAVTKTVYYTVPEEVLHRLKALRRRLSLDVIEVFFKVRQTDWVLHRISTRPEWGRWWHSKLGWASDQLLLSIKSQREKAREVRKKLFIARHMRPRVGR